MLITDGKEVLHFDTKRRFR